MYSSGLAKWCNFLSNWQMRQRWPFQHCQKSKLACHAPYFLNCLHFRMGTLNIYRGNSVNYVLFCWNDIKQSHKSGFDKEVRKNKRNHSFGAKRRQTIEVQWLFGKEWYHMILFGGLESNQIRNWYQGTIGYISKNVSSPKKRMTSRLKR